MGTIVTAISSAFRDFVTDGVQSSGVYEPVKADARAIGPVIEAAIAKAALGSLVSVSKSTRANLDADLAHAADSVALVYADPTEANNDLYVKVGGIGAGTWTLTTVLHDTFDNLAEAVLQPFVDDAEAAAAAAAVISDAPLTFGNSTGQGNAGYNGVAYMPNDPVRAAGLVTKIEWRMKVAATVTIAVVDFATRKVLKKWTGIAAVDGLNTLPGGTIAGYNAPIGAVFMVAVTAGAGNVDWDTTTARKILRSNVADITATAVDANLPAPVQVDHYRPSITVEVTPVNAQTANARLNVQEANHNSETSGFVAKDTETYLRKVGVTSIDANATSDLGITVVGFSEAAPTGGQLVSAYLNMKLAGSGYVVVVRSTDDGKFETIHAQPTGMLAVGANTISLPEIAAPRGARVGYLGISGGGLASIGFVNRLQATVATANINVTPGQKYAWTAATQASEIGFTMRAPRDRFAVSATARQARYLDNRGTEVPRLPTTFMKDTWLPRLAEYDTWKARGVNLFMMAQSDFMDGNTTDQAITDAIAKSVYYIRQPGRIADVNATAAGQIPSSVVLAKVAADAAFDAVSKWCLGFNHLDEPGFAKPREQGTGSPDEDTMRYLERELMRWRAQAGPLPVWMNMAKNMLYPNAMNFNLLNTRGIDVWGFDAYPNEDNTHPWANGIVEPSGTKNSYFSTNYGVGLEMLSQDTYGVYSTYDRPTLSAGKPTFVYIATSRIRSPQTAPLPWEFRMLAWSSIVAGVIGIIYFPQDVTVGAYINDASHADILTEMTTLHANIAVMQAAGALVDDKVGGRVSFQKRLSAPVTTALGTARGTTVPQKSAGGNAVFQAPFGNQMQGGFEGIRIVTRSGAIYYLIVNLLNTATVLDDAEWGIAAMNFAAAEVKFLAATDPATNLFTSSGL